MLRNIIIIASSIGILSWCLYVFNNRNNFGSVTKKTTAGLCLLWLFTSLLPNVPEILSPLTPTIKGIVIDENTKKPIPNCNIKAYWNVETYGLAGANSKAYHLIQTITNDEGYFEIPRFQKALSLYGFFPLFISSRYAGIHIVAYDYSYKYKLIGVDRDNFVWTSLAVNEQNVRPVSETIIFTMEPLNAPQAYILNITELELNILSHRNYQQNLTLNDIKFIQNGVDFLNKHYSKMDCNIYKNGTLSRYSKLIEDIGDIDKSIKIREMGMTICTKEAAHEKSEIERLMQLQKNNQRNGGR